VSWALYQGVLTKTKPMSQRKVKKVEEPVKAAPNDDEQEKDEKGTYVAATMIYILALTPALGAAFLLSMLPRILGEAGGAVVTKALGSAFKGGIPGAVSALVQIVLLMWLRTVTNYQVCSKKSWSLRLSVDFYSRNII
jgi:hypothetical protein